MRRVHREKFPAPATWPLSVTQALPDYKGFMRHAAKFEGAWQCQLRHTPVERGFCRFCPPNVEDHFPRAGLNSPPFGGTSKEVIATMANYKCVCTASGRSMPRVPRM